MPERDVSRFAHAHGPGLLKFAFLLSGHAATSEDLVNTVLLRLLERGLEGIENPSAYARRAILNEYTSSQRRLQIQFRAMPRLVSRRESLSDTSQPEDRLAVLEALSTLNPRQRAAVVLRYYEDLPDAAIADHLDCSESTVRSLIHRAIPKLRVALSASFGLERGPGLSQGSGHYG